MTPDTHADIILTRLREHVDPDYAASLTTTAPGMKTFEGVRVPVLRDLAKELRHEWKLSPAGWVGVLNHAFPTRHRELILVGLFGLNRKVADFDDFFGERLSGWARHLDNWETTDQLAPTVGSWLLEDLSRVGYPVAWAARGERVWKKRLAAASVIYINRDGHANTHLALKVLRHLMEEDAPEIRKAVAWALREMPDQEAVERFLAWWAPRVPRSLVNEGSKKLDDERRERLLGLVGA